MPYSAPHGPDTPSSWISRLTQADMTALGESLRQIDPKWVHQADIPTDERVWYQGHEPYFDVMVERQGEGIGWIQFTLRGRVLSWHAKTNRITTGETEELDRPPIVSYYSASKVIRSEKGFDADFVKLAIAILSSRPDDKLLTQVTAVLRQASST